MDLATLILQIGVILVVARLAGWIFRWFNQPQVIGEMVAGMALGPSLLGWIAPGLSAQLFPPASLGFLNLSAGGTSSIMFLVGLELDLKSFAPWAASQLLHNTALSFPLPGERCSLFFFIPPFRNLPFTLPGSRSSWAPL